MTSITDIKEKKTTEIKSVTFGNQRQKYFIQNILFFFIILKSTTVK